MRKETAVTGGGGGANVVATLLSLDLRGTCFEPRHDYKIAAQLDKQ